MAHVIHSGDATGPVTPMQARPEGQGVTYDLGGYLAYEYSDSKDIELTKKMAAGMFGKRT